ncbi:hypothetical protein SBRCBS47491_000203 [Sporothrix bragantina]|uniref:Uncharacterized protein n=1 Tax=Sporothrix bragantina TaxID=671064 RepID=A0ABP0ANE8_9PEZI
MDIFRNARQNFLRRQAEAEQADLERQEARGREAAQRPAQPEMQQQQQQQRQDPSQTARSSPVSTVLRRFADLPRPSMPSFGRQSGNNTAPRPTSSHYTESQHPDDEIVSPKTPQFALGMPPMPSTRLHLPNLQRTWTRGSSGPPTRPGTAIAVSMGNMGPARPSADITEPVPAYPAQHFHSRSQSSSEESLGDDGSRRDRRRRHFEGADPAEMHLATMANDGRRRRHHRQESSRSGGRRQQRRYVVEMVGAPPQASPSQPTKRKRFLFCFPYIKSRRMRAQILRCFVSGIILILLVGIFLALYLSSNIYNTEFEVLLIMIVLLTAIFFAHGLVRLCMMVLHPLSPAEEAAAEERYRRRHGGQSGLPNIYGPGGYAIPHQPIRVVLARDEEAAGLESVTAKIQPPAYGLWRESVRVDPNRIYWQRNEDASVSSNSSRSRDASNNSSRSRSQSSGRGANMRGGAASSDADNDNSARDSTDGRQSPRPPSYMSDDGVQYVVEAQPRSIAPTAEIPLPQHPAEVGRTAPRPAW